MSLFGVNAVGEDGKLYGLYFECEDFIDCEMMIRQLNLNVPEGAYGKVLTLPAFGPTISLDDIN